MGPTQTLSPNTSKRKVIRVHKRRHQTRRQPSDLIYSRPEKIPLDILPGTAAWREHGVFHIAGHLGRLRRSDEHG